VAQVVPDSPAEAAGLQPGDVIVRFAGESIERSGDLPHVVGLLEPDSEAEVELIRAGVRERLTVTIGTLADPGETVAAGKGGSPKDDDRLGLTLEPLTDALKERLQVDAGVVVRAVSEGPAAEAGLRPGDVITRLNNLPIASLGDFQEAAQNLPAGRSVPILVVRRGVPVFLALPLPEDN
jgi:serine protease Do